ncbi:MAG: hypothetical protein AAFV95_07215 [Bacteroidota bacterium]
MHLHCPECESDIQADDVNLVKTIAKCQTCNNIFEFSEQLDQALPPAPYREELLMPPGIEVLKLMSELEIMVNWRAIGSRFTLFFCLLWNGFIFFITFFVALAGQWPFVLFLTPFLLVGLYLIYSSLGYLFNTTYITVNSERVSIEHRPINFLIQSDKYYHSSDIEQVFVQRYSVGSSNGNPVYAFSIVMALKNGTRETLVKNLHSDEYGKYIEQQIELFLKIKDRPVKGEWGKKGS